MQKLLTYPKVKAIFGWKSTTSIRRYIASGDLVRVHLGKGMNTYRVTEESVQAFIERLKSKHEQDAYAERAARHTAHMRRGLPAPEPEVMLDAEEIIRQSHIRTPRPAEKLTLDEVIAERSQSAAPLPTAPRRAGLGFRSMRGI